MSRLSGQQRRFLRRRHGGQEAARLLWLTDWRRQVKLQPFQLEAFHRLAKVRPEDGVVLLSPDDARTLHGLIQQLAQAIKLAAPHVPKPKYGKENPHPLSRRGQPPRKWKGRAKRRKPRPG